MMLKLAAFKSDPSPFVSAMINIMKELSDARVEELELQVASLHDLVERK